MISRLIRQSLVIGVLALIMTMPTLSRAEDGSCVGPAHADLSRYFGDDGRGEGPIVWVIIDGAGAYATEDAGTPDRRLDFSLPLYVVGDGRDRLLVRRTGDAENEFWVDRKALMCQKSPIVDERTFVEKKVFIRTETRVRSEEGVTVTGYKTPDLTGCDDGNCRKLSRFELYFVMSETEDAFLIGEDLRWASARQQLVGWVDKDEAIEWNWTVGLRPRHDLTYNGGPGRICAYVSKEDARARRDCQPILGGNEWFRLNFRLPILDEHDADKLWEVAVPSSGVSGTVADSNSVRLNPALLGGVSTDTVTEIKNVDVFFLIDGTSSMQPYIDSIVGRDGQPGVVGSIQQTLAGKFSLGTSIRFGFRIFRDTLPGSMTTIGEGLPLDPNSCGSLSPEEQRINQDEFSRRIQSVRASSNDRDDFPEDILGGISQAARDMQACENNLKLVFVIGDAGYDAARQMRINKSALTHRGSIQRLNRFKNALMFFIRTPIDMDTAKTKPTYFGAWTQFKGDFEQIMASLKIMPEIEARPNDFFIDIPAGGRGYDEFLQKIVRGVDQVAQPTVLEDVAIDLRGGASLQDVIDRLRDERSDVPGLFWKILERNACKDLGDQCSERVYQGISTLFIPYSDDLELELWMGRTELRSWRRFIDAALDTKKTPGERRFAITSAMSKSLEDILGDPPYDGLMTISEWLRKYRGLPSRFNSPLLAYSTAEIEEASIVPRCELARIFNWLDAVKQMLDDVGDEGTLVTYETLAASEFESCGSISRKGADIPLVDPTSVRGIEMGPTAEYSLKKSSGNRQIYWVPQSYLP